MAAYRPSTKSVKCSWSLDPSAAMDSQKTPALSAEAFQSGRRLDIVFVLFLFRSRRGGDAASRNLLVYPLVEPVDAVLRIDLLGRLEAELVERLAELGPARIGLRVLLILLELAEPAARLADRRLQLVLVERTGVVFLRLILAFALAGRGCSFLGLAAAVPSTFSRSVLCFSSRSLFLFRASSRLMSISGSWCETPPLGSSLAKSLPRKLNMSIGS
ncbi:MAG: hypothetical protein E5V74_02175 [Mesorhizobium sp.]|nr:MAG: hypothetical protein E5V74_02175 [Mesorhizobium sp.]